MLRKSLFTLTHSVSLTEPLETSTKMNRSAGLLLFLTMILSSEAGEQTTECMKACDGEVRHCLPVCFFLPTSVGMFIASPLFLISSCLMNSILFWIQDVECVKGCGKEVNKSSCLIKCKKQKAFVSSTFFHF